MPAGELYIKTANTISPQDTTDPNETDGWVDAFKAWGLSMEDEGLGRLIAPDPHKPPVTNKNATAHGAHIVTGIGLLDEVTISLPVHITAVSRAQFWQRFAAFCEVLQAGGISVKTCYQPSVTYDFTYQACQNFSEFMQEMAKFDLILYKNNEPFILYQQPNSV